MENFSDQNQIRISFWRDLIPRRLFREWYGWSYHHTCIILQKDRENVITVKQFVPTFKSYHGLKHRINFLVCQEDFSWYKNAINTPGYTLYKTTCRCKG